MVAVAYDIFTGTTSDSLYTYSSKWTDVHGNFTIQTNALALDNSSHSCGSWNADTFTNDQYAQVLITAIASNSAWIGVTVRGSLSVRDYYLFDGNASNSNGFYYVKYVAGTPTTLTNGNGITAVNDVIRLEVIGTTLDGQLNGVTQLGTQTDSSITGGYAGVGGFGVNTVNRLDEWEGGNLEAGAVIPSLHVATQAQATSADISVTISAAQAGRVLVLCNLAKDDTTTVAIIDTMTFDSAGANATIANGEILLQGVTNIPQEGVRSSQNGVYFILDSDLPTSAGTYTFSYTYDLDIDRYLWIIFEVLGCPDEAYDNLVQDLSLADVAVDTAFSASITPTVDDCLIVDIWATSHSNIPTFTSTETQVGVALQSNAGGVVSKFEQGTAASKTMEQSSSTLHQRRAWTLMSFSGVASVGGTTGKSNPLSGPFGGCLSGIM